MPNKMHTTLITDADQLKVLAEEVDLHQLTIHAIDNRQFLSGDPSQQAALLSDLEAFASFHWRTW